MEVQTGVALHQWPRDKELRKILVPPPGFLLVEHDFSGQEMRWMCELSGDATMRLIFQSEPPYDNAHGYMGAALSGRRFKDLISALNGAEGPEAQKKAVQDRYLGKFANLSLQYRVGIAKLLAKARIEYNLPMVRHQAEEVSRKYKQEFQGVPQYWESQIRKARGQGYVEAPHGKRYRFAPGAWAEDKRWSSESTAINWPIQCVGAGQKVLALDCLLPYLDRIGGEFAWDLHDGLFSFMPEGIAMECALEAKYFLSNLPYEKEWGFSPSIPFPVDAKVGLNWGDLVELK